MDCVMCRYLLRLQIAQRVVIALNLLRLAAIVMFGNIFSCRIVDVWNSLPDAVAKSTSVASFKNNLSNVDLLYLHFQRLYNVIYHVYVYWYGMLVSVWPFAFFTLNKCRS